MDFLCNEKWHGKYQIAFKYFQILNNRTSLKPMNFYRLEKWEINNICAHFRFRFQRGKRLWGTANFCKNSEKGIIGIFLMMRIYSCWNAIFCFFLFPFNFHGVWSPIITNCSSNLFCFRSQLWARNTMDWK